MEKYKVCPCCGSHNPPKLLECLQCETDLSNVRVIDETMEVKEKSDDKGTDAGSVQMVRVCDCGTHNPVNVRKCVSCGEDISDIIPTPEHQENRQGLRFILTSLDGVYAFEITEPTVLIGREASMQEYLQTKMYVSRNHGEITVEDGHLFLRNLSRTNYTYINNERIPDGKTEIHDGDEIGLGGNQNNGLRQEKAAYFQVRIGTCI